LALVDSDPYGLKILSVYMKVRMDNGWMIRSSSSDGALSRCRQLTRLSSSLSLLLPLSLPSSFP